MSPDHAHPTLQDPTGSSMHSNVEVSDIRSSHQHTEYWICPKATDLIKLTSWKLLSTQLVTKVQESNPQAGGSVSMRLMLFSHILSPKHS